MPDDNTTDTDTGEREPVQDRSVPTAGPDADTLELPIIPPPVSTPRTRDSDHVAVRFEGDAWHITGAGIDGELVFNELADAERRAIELSRDLHVGVIVYGDRESVVARY